MHDLTRSSQAANNVIEFLKNWYEVFPEFEHMDVRMVFRIIIISRLIHLPWQTYLAGESFAGQFIPYTGQYLLFSRSQSKWLTKTSSADAILKTARIKPHLKGLAIGNGWIDPWTQYPSYVDFAVQEKLLQTGTKVRSYLFEITLYVFAHLSVPQEYDFAVNTLNKCLKELNTTTLHSAHVGECEPVMGSAIEHLHQS